MRKREHQLIFLSRRLEALGIDLADQDRLRRIEMTLSRWSERECGTENGGAIERDETTGKPYWTFEGGGPKRCRYQIADKERGALRRLGAIMARYPDLWAYHQGDPRGCALYVGRWADLPGGTVRELDSHYTCGVAVCL